MANLKLLDAGCYEENDMIGRKCRLSCKLTEVDWMEMVHQVDCSANAPNAAFETNFIYNWLLPLFI